MKHTTSKQLIKSVKAILIIITMTLGITPLIAQEHDMNASNKKADHIMVKPDNVKWGDAPTSIPAGAKASVIEGDPKAAGLFTMRLSLPAGYLIPAHWHPADEHVTVLSGALYMGVGDKYDESKLQSLPAGSFAMMVTGTRHYAATKEATVIQLHGMGPWGIHYVNPADDPRNK